MQPQGPSGLYWDMLYHRLAMTIAAELFESIRVPARLPNRYQAPLQRRVLWWCGTTNMLQVRHPDLLAATAPMSVLGSATRARWIWSTRADGGSFYPAWR